MSTLRQHLDLIAILVLAVIFGIGHMPRTQLRTFRADWQPRMAKVHTLRFNQLIHHIRTR